MCFIEYINILSIQQTKNYPHTTIPNNILLDWSIYYIGNTYIYIILVNSTSLFLLCLPQERSEGFPIPVQHGNVQPNTGHDGGSSGRAGLGMRELWWAPSSLCVSGLWRCSVVKGLVANKARAAQVRAGKGTGVSRSLPAEGWG